jgi:hypothetical protein
LTAGRTTTASSPSHSRTTPDFSPIAGWIRIAGDPEHMWNYVNVGKNVFIGVENPEMTNEDLLRQYGRRTLVQAHRRTRLSGIGAENAGSMSATSSTLSAASARSPPTRLRPAFRTTVRRTPSTTGKAWRSRSRSGGWTPRRRPAADRAAPHHVEPSTGSPTRWTVRTTGSGRSTATT